jgi:hypothetical protein
VIDGVSLVNLNVSVKDQDLAKSFWTETVGFELVSDQQMGPERWIRVTPPDRSVVLVLGHNNPNLAEFLKERAASVSSQPRLLHLPGHPEDLRGADGARCGVLAAPDQDVLRLVGAGMR